MAPIIYGWMLGLVVMARSVLGGGADGARGGRRWRGPHVADAGLRRQPRVGADSREPQLGSCPDSGSAPLPVRFARLGHFAGGLGGGGRDTTRAEVADGVGWSRSWCLRRPLSGDAHRTEYRHRGPTQLSQQSGPIFEMIPVTENRESTGTDGSPISAASSSSHGQAIAEDCVHTKPASSAPSSMAQDKLLREDMEASRPPSRHSGSRPSWSGQISSPIAMLSDSSTS